MENLEKALENMENARENLIDRLQECTSLESMLMFQALESLTKTTNIISEVISCLELDRKETTECQCQKNQKD